MNMKKTTITLFALIVAIMAMADADVPFSLNGLETDDHVTVTISSESYLKTMDISANGDYTFRDVPTGVHYLKVEAVGYNLPDSKVVNVKEDGTIEPFTGIKLVITKMDEDDSKWTHSWHEDGSISGYTTTAYVNKPAVIEYLGKKIVPADVPSQSILETSYHIILSNDGVAWTQEYAYRLLETMKMFPQHPEIVSRDTIIISLTNEHITDDILMQDYNEGRLVTIATDAFAYANPFLVNLDGVRGRFFSKRLHHAIVNMLTNYGTDKWRADWILRDCFGCSIYPPSYEELTRGTTDEDAGCFQEFVARELVEIINMFEEMPEGFHKIPHLNYLIRRQNGHPHPTHPEAAAVAWSAENGYIEFMEAAFSGTLFDIQRLLLHEKTHMLWAFVFSDEIKNDWIELGGWYPDPNKNDGWSTTKDVEFVSAYSHAINPNEDMAESVASYIKNPDALMSRSLPKYEFIRDRIMHGTRYISKIRDDLTFEVLNLNPDYDYPGKIKSLDLQVLGKPEEDKTVIIDITLNHMEGFEDGAAAAILRMSCPKYIDSNGEQLRQIADMWLFPVNGDEYHLRGEVSISKYSKAGYWTCSDITVQDLQGNARFEGSHDFVWNMYINNPLEDLYLPVYEKGSLRYELTDTIVDGHQAQNLEVIYKITDDTGINKTFVRLSLGAENTYSCADKYGTYDPETQEAHINFLITEFYPSEDYYVSQITFYDYANSSVVIPFSDSPLHEPVKKIHITTSNPDTDYPELDLNRIFVYAEPTHPEAPDGETLVTINYYARDNKSGLGHVDYRLRDPQGMDYFEYHYHRNFYTDYFDGDATVWERYTINVVLPRGSAPGIWGLAELSLEDKALNRHTYNFVETLIFEPDENLDDYILFAEMTDDDMLKFDLTAISGNTTGYSYVYRVISEESGKEIAGIIDVSGQSGSSKVRRAPAMNGYDVDVSDLPDGKLIVIVQVKDADGEVVAVRSKSLTKNSYQLGDVNRDGKVNVTDAVVLVSHILGENIDGFVLEAADLNNDSEVDVFDVTKIINIILTAGGNSAKVRKAIGARPYTALEQLYVENSADGIMVNVNNAGRFTSFQMDVEVSDGVELTGVQLTVPETGHILRYTKVGENDYRILALSLNNTPLCATADGLLKLDLSNSGDVQINDILFVTPRGEEVQMESLSGNIATDITDIETSSNTEIYDLSGRKLDVDMKQLPKGVYIINGKKVMVK